MVAQKRRAPLTVDVGFPDRVFKTSLILSAIVLVCSLISAPMPVTVGLGLGMAVSLSFFKLLCWTISKLFVKEKRKRATFLLTISLVKYPLIFAVLLYSLQHFEINVFALVGGLSLVFVVMVLKVAGMTLTNYMNAGDQKKKGTLEGPPPHGTTAEELDTLP